MNWIQLIADIRACSLTYEDIKKGCGFASRGHVHDLAHGKQAKVLWEPGDKLIKMHKRVMRRAAAIRARSNT